MAEANLRPLFLSLLTNGIVALGTYVFFAIMCFLGVIWAWTFVPETKGKTLEELDDVFGDATGHEEHEVMRSVAAEARRR